MTAHARGMRAETLAAWLLTLKGFRILERRWSSPVGEIDVIARRGDLLVFVEVKARQDRAVALESVQYRQQARIGRAAGAYLQRHAQYAALDCRFDVIAISSWGWPRHITDAWRL